MRPIRVFLLMLCCFICTAQAPADVGSPESAFTGGPIHLSRAAAAVLRAHYQGDNVPLVPQPFRGKLDNALVAFTLQ